ncbi:hypothetical protein GH975_07360 [Litorivicinus lipolyticus]|uniref:NnrU protein n=1 Tax=Litorivicinus lipolyticus TaxID=418701 RepID=A0A5Q2QEH0_9GAMM|nr:hypothetical protein [Litorivicinus lipolyticus]QGG80397.1 hypothetical protein GH975_07360 [Litorivicinus lipolyticus]
MNGLWETLQGLGYIACVMWVLAAVVGVIRPQVLRKTERMDVIRLCSMGFLVSFLVVANATYLLS